MQNLSGPVFGFTACFYRYRAGVAWAVICAEIFATRRDCVRFRYGPDTTGIRPVLRLLRSFVHCLPTIGLAGATSTRGVGHHCSSFLGTDCHSYQRQNCACRNVLEIVHRRSPLCLNNCQKESFRLLLCNLEISLVTNGLVLLQSMIGEVV